MITHNYAFFKNLLSQFVKSVTLHNSLHSIIAEGIVVKNDCLLMNYFYKRCTKVSLNAFIDKTGYECFVNSFHVDDYVKKYYLEQTFLFIDALVNEIKQIQLTLTIEIIVIQTDSGFKIKMHMVRDHEFWIETASMPNLAEGILLFRFSNA
jgi:hypothetical protein